MFAICIMPPKKYTLKPGSGQKPKPKYKLKPGSGLKPHLKAKVEEKPKKKKLVIKPKKKVVKKVKMNIKPKKKAEPESLGKRQTGLTKEQMNKLSPEELFGQLPVALRKKTLTSGVRVGKLPLPTKFQKGESIRFGINKPEYEGATFDVVNDLYKNYRRLEDDPVNYAKYGPQGGRFKGDIEVVQEAARAVSGVKKIPSLPVKSPLQVFGFGFSQLEETEKYKKLMENNKYYRENAYKYIRNRLRGEDKRRQFDKILYKSIAMRTQEKPKAYQKRKAKQLLKEEQSNVEFFKKYKQPEGDERPLIAERNVVSLTTFLNDSF